MYEKIEELIKASGKTAYQVAKEMGISPSLFSEWKSKKYEPSRNNLDKIADYFGVSVDFLMGRKDQKSA